jgi:transposase
MIELNIKPEDRQAIKQGRYSKPHPRVMRKYDALRLKDCGVSNQLICNILGICNNTLLSIFKQYSEGGPEKIQEINFYHPTGDMKAYSDRIAKYFEENPPESISETEAKIEELTGIKRGETQVRKFLKDMNFRFRRVGTVPAKALTEEKNGQRQFLEQESAPRLKEAQSGKRTVYFVDAVHFVHGMFIVCLWCLQRISVPTPSGRNRYNVSGAIDAVSYGLLTVCNTTCINSLSVCELLEKIALEKLQKKYSAYPCNG